MILTRHYLKSAINSFKRNKWYTLLMVVSLSAGMFCFVLTSIYINYEFSRNTNHEHADKVYRVMLRFGETGRNIYLPLDFAERLSELNPNIMSVSTLDRGKDEYLSADGEFFVKEEDVFYAGPEFFEVLTFPLKYGNKTEALVGPKNIVISNKLAELIFPGLNPVGMELTVHEKSVFQISGVLAPVSPLSVMNPGLIFTRAQRFKERPRTENTWTLLTHIKLKKDIDQKVLEANLYAKYKQLFTNERVTGVFTENLKDGYWGGSHYDYGAQYSSLMGIDRQMVKIVGYVSFGVLICAFIGYLSLSLSLSLRRVKEIGVRKVNGAGRSDIRSQLMAESICYALLSLLATIVALELSENYFSNLFQVPIVLELTKPTIILSLVGFAVFTGIITGIYPALVVSKLNPVTILSGFSSPLGSGFKLKRLLLITQLSVTIVLIFCVLTLKQQVGKMQKFDFGYQKENMVSFGMDNKNIKQNYLLIREDLKRIKGVQEISGGPFPFSVHGYRKMRYMSGDSLIEEQIGLVMATSNFFKAMNIPIVKGEGFDGYIDVPLNQSCIVNEAFVSFVGGNVLGTTIDYLNERRTVIGVAKNYTDWGVRQPKADPRIFLPTKDPKFHSLLIKLNGEKKAEARVQIEAIWRKYESIMEPKIRALDFEEGSITNISKISELFSFLAVVVLILSLMNLFGFSVMFAGSKLKTIGIRRILGAETLELFRRLSIPFLISLSISLSVALPVAYFIMRNYLREFAVRTELNIFQGISVTVLMFLLLFLVTGFQLLRFSRVNPVDVLKNE